MLVIFTVLVKFLINFFYERTILLYKTCHGDFLVIKRQQLKPINHDWITIDHRIVPIKFLNHSIFGLKAYQRRNDFLLTEIILPNQRTQTN